MKRLLIGLALILACTSASAQLMRNSDVLLTDDGTLFTIDAVSPATYDTEHPGEQPLETDAAVILRLKTQIAGRTVSVPVPESLNGGNNVEPSLAYDAADSRLYVFWQRMPSLTSSELLFASYKDGGWTDASVFDSGIWRYRFNLKVAITRGVAHTNEDGTSTRIPRLVAHAIWWEQNGARESARYAMLNLDHGAVSAIEIRDLTDFVTRSNPVPYVLPDDYDKDVFRTPYLFEVPSSDSVDVLFANWDSNRYQLVTIRPVESTADGVLTIPIGVTQSEMDPPIFRNGPDNQGMYAMRAAPGSTNIAIYSNHGSSINYVIYKNGAWSKSNEIVFDSIFKFDAAIEALRRNTATDQ